ncbi:MAG: ABC transporter permease [Longimicrobiales bacterium]
MRRAGIDSERLLTLRIAIPESRYPESEGVAFFFDRLVDRVSALPGVEAAGLGMAAPPNRLVMRNPFTPQGKVYATNERAPVAAELLVDPGFFEALGIRAVRGRLFDAGDRADASPVVIIDEVLAREHFAGADPVGRWLQTGDPAPDADRLTIVGVVPEVKYAGLDAPTEPTIYVPYAQNRWWRSMYLIVRTRGEPLELAAPIRAQINALDPLVPIREINTVEQLASESVSTPRFRALLLGSFGGIALLLACAGIYGVLGYDVAQRRRDTGIRIAIGADAAASSPASSAAVCVSPRSASPSAQCALPRSPGSWSACSSRSIPSTPLRSRPPSRSSPASASRRARCRRCARRGRIPWACSGRNRRRTARMVSPATAGPRRRTAS